MILDFKLPQTTDAAQSYLPQSSTEIKHNSFPVQAGLYDHNPRAKRSTAAEPLKNTEDIMRVTQWLVSHHRYRDNLLFVMGINFGFRAGDLLELRVGDILEADGSAYKDKVTKTEEKTGKLRSVFMNQAVMAAADLYFDDIARRGQTVSLNDYLFTSESNNKSYKEGNSARLTLRSLDRMLKEVINHECHVEANISTHSLRKTFAYHVIINAPDRSRAIEFLQKMFGHSSAAVTLRYAGITDDEIQETYHELNLGLRNDFVASSKKREFIKLAHAQ